MRKNSAKLGGNVQKLQTDPVDCRKKAAVDSHNSIGIERKEKTTKN